MLRPTHVETRWSLQPPCGLPSPVSAHHKHDDTRASRDDHEVEEDVHGHAAKGELPDIGGEGYDLAECDTLISCLTHLSISSLPPPPPFTPSEEYVGSGKHVRAVSEGVQRGRGPVMARFPAPPDPRPSSIIGSREEQRRIYLGPKLSDRATGGPDAGPLIERFSCLFKDQYNCKTNPRGIVSLGVAENFLMEAECLEYFSKALVNGFLASDLSYGDHLWGSRRINKALSGFYNDYFAPHETVLPDQIITGVGCSAVLDQLIYTVMDEGEAILLAAPYYTGFDRDLIGRARVRLIPVDVSDGDDAFSPGSMDAFHAAYEQCRRDNIVVRAVILCNPQNPLGRTYPRDTLLAYARFCEEKDLHLVSDEIYAMSVYDNKDFPTAVPFTSMMNLDVETELGITFDKARLHIIHGMSKDFCANGLRIGALISQHNPLLLRAMASTSMLMKISSPADVIFSSLLNDKAYLSSFIATNKARLGEAHAFIRKWFEERGVPVANVNATRSKIKTFKLTTPSGHFIWVNLGAKLGFSDAMMEKKLFQKLLDGGVYVAPGTAYHNAKAGWYRITFSVSRDNLLVGLGKMEKILGLEVEQQ